jgi:hypothetical protein
MKEYLYLLLIIGITGYGRNITIDITTEVSVNQDSASVLLTTPTLKIEQVDNLNYDHATYYIVIADTNLNYYDLHMKMFGLSEKLNLPIDTMGRSFDRSKNLIALPQNDEDEMFAGDYYPRRFPSNAISLEYLDLYKSTEREKAIALVTGIFETEAEADSALTMVKMVEKNSFKLKANMYIGCIH